MCSEDPSAPVSSPTASAIFSFRLPGRSPNAGSRGVTELGGLLTPDSRLLSALPFWLRPPLAWWRHRASSWHSSPSGGADHKGHLRKRSRAQREAQRMPPMPVLFPALRWLRLTFPRGVCEIPMRIQSHKYMRNDSSCLTCLGTRWSKRCPHGRA